MLNSKPSLISMNASPLELIQLGKLEQARRRLKNDKDGIRKNCQTLAGFVRESWHLLEPTAKLVWNWHLDAICMHLEAVTYGLINRLLINVPPGSSKSLLVSVFWPAWEWTLAGKKSLRYLATAFNEDPVKRDTRKCRDLILSDWYQSLWPDIKLVRAAELSFANDGTGTREGIAFGSLTSQRGDRLIIDDPHSTETAESPADRAATTRKFREGALNRLNDQEKSAIIVIMQRLHEDDVSGTIIKLGMGYVHLMLPMEYEVERACTTRFGNHTFTDPRTNDGDLLDPVRFPRDTLTKMKRDTTQYAWAGQYQQRPTAREGGLFKREWFDGKIISHAPEGTKWVRHWDLAGTKKKTSARTAGVLMGKMPDGRFVVGHVVKVQEEGAAVRKLIKTFSEVDGKGTKISLPQDPGQAGKVQAQDYVGMLAGYAAFANIESGDKYTRAEPFSAQCEIGNVCLVRGEWNIEYLDELCLFPNGTFADQVDASSGAFGFLITDASFTYGMLSVSE